MSRPINGNIGLSPYPSSPFFIPRSIANHILLFLSNSLVLLVSLAASFSPLSSNIYFPALDLIADTFGTNNSTFITSVSIYMYVQRDFLQKLLHDRT